MTTPNGGRVVEHLSGTVASANERGVKLDGDDGEGWRNFSKFGEPIAPPRRGQRVSLGLDAAGFVRELQVLDQAPSATSATSSSDRLTVLKAAAHFVGLWGQNREDVRSDHVLVLADKWLAWVEQTEDSADG
jgi:hypothetical protein